jgi:hypothetical protein
MKTRARGSVTTATSPTGFQPVATVEIDAVSPSDRGFTLVGQGNDRANYRIDLHFDLPLDPRTRTVLGELLAQSDLSISRRNS